MKCFFYLFVLITAPLVASERPHWITETPSGYIHEFYVGVGRSSVSESDARNVSLANAIQTIVQSGTITVKGSQEIKTQSTEKFTNGQSVNLESVDNIVNEILIEGESQTLKGLREEEYYAEFSNGEYTVWSLIKIPKKNPRKDLPPTKMDAVWRSALLPSWGQFYKREFTKGYFIAGGTAVFLTSGFVLSNLKITAESDAKISRTQVLRDYYNDQANTYNNLSLACFIVTAAVYIYNVVDAVAAEGEKVYVYEPQPKNYKIDITQNVFPKPQNLLCIKIDL
jgi:hypothetical protein